MVVAYILCAEVTSFISSLRLESKQRVDHTVASFSVLTTCMSFGILSIYIYFGSPFLFTGKDFLRAAQMNMNFATWGRLMMSILPPCSSLEPLSPPLAGPNPGSTSSSTSLAG